MTFQGIQQLRVLFAAVAVGAIAGCSAGGGDRSSPTPSPTPPTAASLSVSVSKNTLSTTGADSTTITATTLDANNNVVASIPVTFKPDTGILTPAGTTTSASGTLTAALGIGSDHSNRTINVVVGAGALSKTVAITVQGDTLTASNSGSVAAGASSSIAYTLLDAAAVAIADAPVTVSMPGQADVSGKTDANGKYTYSYTMPAAATVVTATAAGVSTTTTVTPSGGSTVTPDAGTVNSASLSANPSSVTTGHQAELRALFIGANNAPIANVRTRFQMVDSNSIGGTLTSDVNSVIYSDSNGIARTTYTAGTRGGVITPKICWSSTDFPANTCPNAVTASSLTVVASGVSLAALTNGLIGQDDTKNVYTISYVVQVVDASNQPIAGSTVTGAVDIPRFYRGLYAVTSGKWSSGIFNDNTYSLPLVGRQSCDNEDVNRNNVLETGEDANLSLTLEPFKASVAITPTSAGSNVTDSFGKAYFTLQYGQNYASWEDVVMTFTTSVEGTEGHTSASSSLPVPATVIANTAADPPFKISPYNATNGVLPYTVLTTPVTNPGVIYPSTATFNLCGSQP